jgi:hypothetical protein
MMRFNIFFLEIWLKKNYLLPGLFVHFQQNHENLPTVLLTCKKKKSNNPK